MKKYLVATLVAGTLLTTSALANGKCDCNKVHKSHMNKKHGSKKMPFMGLMKKLDLNDTQKKQIQNIRQSSFKNQALISSFFANGRFDKEGYIKSIQTQKEINLEQKANAIEKIYNVLTPKQKEKFLALLKAKEAKKLNNKANSNCFR